MMLPEVDTKTRRDMLLPGVLLVTGIACIAITGWELLFRGPFWWHIAQPQFWQGGIEALALIGLLGATQLLRHRTLRIALTLVLAELYVRRHAAGIPSGPIAGFKMNVTGSALNGWPSRSQ